MHGLCSSLHDVMRMMSRHIHDALSHEREWGLGRLLVWHTAIRMLFCPQTLASATMSIGLGPQACTPSFFIPVRSGNTGWGTRRSSFALGSIENVVIVTESCEMPVLFQSSLSAPHARSARRTDDARRRRRKFLELKRSRRSGRSCEIVRDRPGSSGSCWIVGPIHEKYRPD